MKAKVEKIKLHNINCFVNRQLIYNWPEQLFADAGIMSIEHADFDGVERLALVTGKSSVRHSGKWLGLYVFSYEYILVNPLTNSLFYSGSEIASTFDHPELVKLGHCDLIEEIMIGEDKAWHFELTIWWSVSD